MTDNERRILQRNLGFFTTADSLAANNIGLGTYRHTTAPECHQFLRRQTLEKAIHTHAYQHIRESLDLEPSEIFSADNEAPSIRNKDVFLILLIDAIMAPHVHTATPEDNQTLLKSRIVFACWMERLLCYDAAMFQGYLRCIAHRRATQIGLKPLFPGAENSVPWMCEMIDLKKEHNFLKTRAIEYQSGGALSWD